MTIATIADYSAGTRVNHSPALYLFDDFASPEETAELIGIAGARLGRAEVSAGPAGKISEGRTGSNCWLGHDETPLVLALARRIAALVAMPLVNAESFQVVHYTRGQHYAPHFDAWDVDSETGRRCMARGGQRLVTCLIYLNDVAEGGGTGFPKLDLEVRPTRGRMLVFHNCFPGTGIRHPHSLHGGLPVTAGEKWAANLWFRERDYRLPAAPEAARTFGRVV